VRAVGPALVSFVTVIGCRVTWPCNSQLWGECVFAKCDVKQILMISLAVARRHYFCHLSFSSNLLFRPIPMVGAKTHIHSNYASNACVDHVCRLVFLACASTLTLGGAIGVALKSYLPCSCSHADSFGFIRDPRSKFSVSSACGIVLSHKCIGNALSIDHHPADI
jgi:hypothetical protein